MKLSSTTFILLGSHQGFKQVRVLFSELLTLILSAENLTLHNISIRLLLMPPALRRMPQQSRSSSWELDIARIRGSGFTVHFKETMSVQAQKIVAHGVCRTLITSLDFPFLQLQIRWGIATVNCMENFPTPFLLIPIHHLQ